MTNKSPIRTVQECVSYEGKYKQLYHSYEKLLRELEENRETFQALGEKWNNEVDPLTKKNISNQIRSLYHTKHNEITKKVDEVKNLHNHLKLLKLRISEFVKKRSHTNTMITHGEYSVQPIKRAQNAHTNTLTIPHDQHSSTRTH